jgi:hypothetical protein
MAKLMTFELLCSTFALPSRGTPARDHEGQQARTLNGQNFAPPTKSVREGTLVQFLPVFPAIRGSGKFRAGKEGKTHRQ